MAAILGTWSTPACEGGSGQPAPQAASGIFGGAGGIIEAVPLAGSGGNASANGGTGGGGSSAAPDECQNTPPGTLAMIDNFDDGDSNAAFEANREAYWFTVHDESAGMLEPPNQFLPVDGGYHGTKGAHVSASGFTIWGAELAANISHKAAIRCPYNASAFAGLRFVARGSGRFRLQVAMPEVIDKEYGGKCDPGAGDVCYDQHGLFITLTEDYRTYEVPWASLTQRGFGRAVAFNPKTIMTLYFSMETADLPIDLWIDDVTFWDGAPSPATGGAGGSGAGGNSAGGAGEASGGATGGARDDGGAAPAAGGAP